MTNPDAEQTGTSAQMLNDYDDLPEAVQEHLADLELFIGDCDGKETVISNGETCIDDGTIDAGDAVKAFNGIVAAIRAEAVAAKPKHLRHCPQSRTARARRYWRWRITSKAAAKCCYLPKMIQLLSPLSAPPPARPRGPGLMPLRWRMRLRRAGMQTKPRVIR